MKTAKALMLSICLFALFASSQRPAIADEFLLSEKAYQATIVKIEGINSSKALAVGEVRRDNAKEYCDRDPGGTTKQYGGKLTKEQCVAQLLKAEQGGRYWASADCPRRTISISHLGTFTLVGQSFKDGLPEYKWRNTKSGEILDGSAPSGALLVEAHFRKLCPAYMTEESSSPKPDCVGILKTHGFLSRAQFQCGFNHYSEEMLQKAKVCAQTLKEAEMKALVASGMQTFDRNERERGHAEICKEVLRDFPNIIRK
jgi:hypothetical protein